MPGACKRAEAIARGLARDLEQLLGDGPAPPAGSLRSALGGLDSALGAGLGYDPATDPEVAYRRGHARNLALVLRRTVEASLGTGTDATRRADLLAQGLRFAEELVETVGWIRQRASEPPAAKRDQPWATSWAGRLIALSARLLRPELRYEFVEDQCGNLASVESRREWLGYLLGLLTRMPRIAAAAAPGRTRW
jgi:hypothetical protein